MNHVTFRNTKASATCENTKLTGTQRSETEVCEEYKVEERQTGARKLTHKFHPPAIAGFIGIDSDLIRGKLRLSCNYDLWKREQFLFNCGQELMGINVHRHRLSCSPVCTRAVEVVIRKLVEDAGDCDISLRANCTECLVQVRAGE
ncbi:hypothetical protein CBL_10699 [Carabus blaptoides fortunei]